MTLISYSLKISFTKVLVTRKWWYLCQDFVFILKESMGCVFKLIISFYNLKLTIIHLQQIFGRNECRLLCSSYLGFVQRNKIKNALHSRFQEALTVSTIIFIQLIV